MKKILAFTLALAMVLSTWTSTFAASKEVEALANLKLLLNTTDAEVNADLTRAVGLAMVLKALGYTQEDANAKMAENTFVDLDKAAWAKGFAKLGEDLKITNGTSVEPKLFSPNWKLNERAFVAFLLRALGHDVDAAWAKAGELAKENGLTETVSENKLTKGEAAVIMYNALKAKVVGDEKGRTLAEKLVADKKLDKELAVANGLISAEPEKLTVSAMADNLIEVKVMFDGTVDKATAEKIGNYRVKGRAVTGVTVMDDLKSVVLTLDIAMQNKAEQELTVNNVKNVAGKVMDKQVVKFMTNDVTAPTVEKIVVTGPRNFDITFSEPIKKTELKVYVKQDKSLFNTSVAEKLSNSGRTVSVSMYSDFKDGKEYVVAVGNSRTNSEYAIDYAGYKSAYYEEALTYTKDTTAPEAKVVKFDQKEVTLEFTKPVKGFAAKKENFYHTFTAYTPVEIHDEEGSKITDASKPYSKVKLVFKTNTEGNALPAGKVILNVLGKVAGSEIKDNWGNLLANAAIELDVVADREAPQVTAVEVEKKLLKVTFNEAVIKDGAKISLIDKDGKVVEKKESGSITLVKDNKVMEVTLAKEYTGKTMTVKIETVKDASLYQNLMLEHTAEVSFVDTVYEGLDKAEFFRTGDKPENFRHFVYLTYKEEMDDSVLDTENYRFTKGDKTAKVQGGADFLDGNKKIVVIELTYNSKNDKEETDIKFLSGDQTADNVNGTKITVSDKVKDLAGNGQSNFGSAQSENITKLAENGFKVKEVRAVATDRVEVEFNNAIYGVSELVNKNGANDNYKLERKDASTDAKKFHIVQVSKKSEKVLELIIAENGDKKLLPIDPALGAEYVEFIAEKGIVTDVFGRSSEAVATAAEEGKVKDKISPLYETVKYEKNAAETTEQMYTTLKTGKTEFDGRKAIKIDTITHAGADENVVHTAKVTIKFKEAISGASLSRLTFSVNKGWSVKVDQTSPLAPAANLDGGAKEVSFTIEKRAKFATVKDLKDDLVDLTVAQVQDLTDIHGNVLKASNEPWMTLYDGQ